MILLNNRVYYVEIHGMPYFLIFWKEGYFIWQRLKVCDLCNHVCHIRMLWPFYKVEYLTWNLKKFKIKLANNGELQIH